MGLPRYLNDQLEKMGTMADGKGPLELASYLAVAMRCFGEKRLELFEQTKEAKGKENSSFTFNDVVFCFAKWGLRASHSHIFFGYRKKDDLDRIQSKLYIGLCEDGEAVFRSVEIPRYFEESLRALNAKREAADQCDAKWREEVAAHRSRVYKSRSFPAGLRALIFERDKHTCQDCLHDREKLQQLGRRLDVDHIIAWEDGGQTSYENGTTLCNVCNIAKHATKRFTTMAHVMRMANSGESGHKE
jgi:5-methylcytosine-specific restriction endonuclease McrA